MRALLAGTLLAVAVTFPYVLHLDHALPGGVLDGPRQLALWLPWQLYANVASGRGLGDASGFAFGGDAGLFALVGNPGAAAVLAPLHALDRPILAHNLGVFLLGATNVAAMWALGATRGGGGPLLAALAGASGWWWAQLGDGAPPAGWIAPAAAALACWRRRRPRAGDAFAVVGALAAPLPTAVAAAVGGRGIAAVACVLAALFLPPLGSDAPLADFVPAGVTWLSGTAGHALPLLFAGGVYALWRGRRRGLAALLLAVALLAAAPPPVDGFALAVPRLPAPRAWLSAVLFAATLAALRALAGAGPLLRAATALLLLVEPRAQALLGQPALPWTGDRWPVPALFELLGERPYARTILQLPLTQLREGMVGWVPFHRQRITGGPGMEGDGPIRRAIGAAMYRDPALGGLFNVEAGDDARLDGPSVRFALRRAGYGTVVLYGQDPTRRMRVQGALGRPVYEDAWLVAWTVE